MHKHLQMAAVVSLTIALAACNAGSSGTSAPGAPGTPPPAVQIVGVAGTHLTLNNVPWLSRGVTIRAFVATPAVEQALDPVEYKGAQNYGVAELSAARAYGADTVRFLVSQPALDPQSSLYDATFVQAFIAGVNLPRQNGFVVVIDMQDESDSGETNHQPLATAETERNWDMLTSIFGGDRGVVFDLYNEPALPESAANWALWANGDPQGTSTVAPGAIGMQTLVTRVRGEGAQNVIVLDGLGVGKTLNQVEAVTDPLGRVVYAVHPYFGDANTENTWDTDFGIPSLTLPVWANEWSANSGTGPLDLGDQSDQISVDFLNYLRAHSISLGTGAFDLYTPPFVVTAVPGWTPSNYDNYVAGQPGCGSGQLVHVLFTTNYSRPLTAQDGL